VSTIEKYRNAPLVLAILQVTHPASPPLTRGEEAGLKQALVATLPLMSQETMNQIEFNVMGGGEPASRVHTAPIVRFSTRDRRTAVTFGPTAITFETTKYDTWEALRSLAATVLSARMDVAPVDGVERIGLRYIDELRVPGEGVPNWRDWVNPELAAPILEGVEGILRPEQQQATLQYSTQDPEVIVALRYGAVVGPSSSGGGVPVAPTPPPPGPFFLIDTDAAWTPGPGSEVPALEADSVLSRADTLHGFVKQLFEASLTEKLRAEVLNAAHH